MRTLCFIILAAFISSSKPPVVKNKDFQVVSASSQTSFGGIAGSPVTTLYTIRIKALRSFTLVADSIFVDHKIDRFSIVKDSFHHVDTMKLKKGKIVEINLLIKSESAMGGGNYQVKIPGSREAEPPKGYSGLVMRYWGGKCRHLAIKTVEKKPDLMMP